MENKLVDKIKAEFKEFENKKQVLIEELRKDFPNLLKPLFDKSKKIDYISWTQYTPYFNDGDTCSFSSGAGDAYPNNLDWDYNHTGGYDWLSDRIYLNDKLVENPEYDKEESNIMVEIREVLEEIPDDFYRDLFGDHVKVTVYKDGRIKVDDYDHE